MLLIALRRLTGALPTKALPCLLTALIWSAMVEVAMAQPPGVAPPAQKEYYLQYLLVALCIALGLLAALRPSPLRDPEGGGASWFSMAMGGGHGPETPAKPGERRKQPHRGAQLLVLSILGIACCLFAIMGMSMAKQDLAAMKAGKMDKSGEQLTKMSFWISVAALALWAIGTLIGALVSLL